MLHNALLLICFMMAMYGCNQKQDGQETKESKTINTAFSPVKLHDTIGNMYYEYYSNGKLKLNGELKNGNRQGEWSAYYENGKLWSRGEYIDGKREGLSTVYYPNGVLKIEGSYKNNVPVGIWKFYDEKGKLLKESTR